MKPKSVMEIFKSIGYLKKRLKDRIFISSFIAFFGLIMHFQNWPIVLKGAFYSSGMYLVSFAIGLMLLFSVIKITVNIIEIQKEKREIGNSIIRCVKAYESEDNNYTGKSAIEIDTVYLLNHKAKTNRNFKPLNNKNNP